MTKGTSTRLSSVVVVHLTTAHSAEDIRIFWKECIALATEGFSVSLVAPGNNKSWAHSGVQIKTVGSYRTRMSRMLLQPFKVWRAALSFQADVYHLHDHELLPLGLLVSLTGRRVIFDMHENLPKSVLTKTWIPSWLRLGVSRITAGVERLLLSRMPVVFAETSYVGDYPWIKNFEVVLNMPRLELLSLSASWCETDRARVVYVGVVAPERGSEVTVEALRILKARGRIVDLDCIGPLRSGASSEPLAQARSGQTIRCHGFVPPADAMQIVAGAHVGLALLAPLPNYVDSFPTKIFEYMALGIPVVTSHFHLYRSVVERERCGLCVDPRDPVAVADAIQWILDNPNDAREMGARGRRAAESRYGWDQQARALITFYRQLLQHPARH